MNINSISKNTVQQALNTTNNRNAAKTGNKSAQAAESTQAADAAEQSNDMDAFKQEIYDEISNMRACTSTSISVQISDSAFERMKSDPKFKEEMIDIIRRDMAGCQPPITSLMINIDEKGYSGQSYNSGYGADKVKKHEEKSFYKRPAVKKDTYKDEKVNSNYDLYSKWLEEQRLQKSDANKKIFQEIIEKSKQAGAVTDKVLGAYESNFMIQETN
jgi:hypothetical protein